MSAPIEQSFRSRTRALLAGHPTIVHRWIDSADAAGARIDLVCCPGTPNEVWVSVRSDTIAIGDVTGHDDFEDFGRGLTAEEIVEEALGHFIHLLAAHGHLEAPA